MTLSIARADPCSAVAGMLFAASDAYSAALYPPEDRHPVTPEAMAARGGVFLLARRGMDAVGCGAIMPYEGFAEIKRMFVLPAERGRGTGRALLTALERKAATLGFRLLRLETGVKQPEALGLYRAAGYHPRGPYGGFGKSAASLYFEKAL